MASAMSGMITSRIMRARPWRSEPRCFGGRVSCCGVNLRTVSAIARFGVRLFLLDNLTQVVLDGGKAGQQLRDLGTPEARKRRFHHVFPEIAQAPEQWPCGRREKEPLGASVIGIGAPFDQPVLREPVEQARERDGL